MKFLKIDHFLLSGYHIQESLANYACPHYNNSAKRVQQYDNQNNQAAQNFAKPKSDFTFKRSEVFTETIDH